MPSSYFQEEGFLFYRKENYKLTPSERKRQSKVKPEGFADLEALVKDLFEAQGQSYFEWLHQQHQAQVLDFNLKNKGIIASLAKEKEA